jgi:signal transduction histidine kinase
MNIRTKLSIGYLIAAFLIATMGLLGLRGILNISHCFNELVESTCQEIPTLEKLSAQFFNMRLESTTCIALLENDNTRKHVGSLNAFKKHSPAGTTDLDEGNNLLTKRITQFNAANDNAKKLIALYLSYTPDFNAPIADSLEQVRLLHERVFQQILDNSNGYTLIKSSEMLDLLEVAEEKHIEKITDALKDETDFAAREGANADSLVIRSKWLIGIISFLTIGLAILLGLFLAQHISKPLSLLTEATEQLGQGHYQSKVQIQRSDEIGILATAFNRMVDELEHAKILEQQKQQLEALNDELNRKNQALDSFVYRVSHDLKAPIVNIASLIAMLQKKWLAPDKRLEQTMVYISNSTVKLQQTITDLLELSRLEQKTEKQLEKIDLQGMVKGIKESLYEQVKQANATIVTDFANAPPLMFSKIDMESILTNLIGNAIKYARQDVAPRVVIRSVVADSAICISVSDNGMGIDLERHKDKLYGMFTRFHDHVEGSGVGLYITRKLVTDAGGKIEIQSTVNVGTTFNIYLPLCANDLVKNARNHYPFLEKKAVGI